MEKNRILIKSSRIVSTKYRLLRVPCSHIIHLLLSLFILCHYFVLYFFIAYFCVCFGFFYVLFSCSMSNRLRSWTSSICKNVGKKTTKTESERVRRMIPFETLQYGETFTNETFDIYGVDLPKGTKLLFL